MRNVSRIQRARLLFIAGYAILALWAVMLSVAILSGRSGHAAVAVGCLYLTWKAWCHNGSSLAEARRRALGRR